jgi:hypothetical protein
VPSKAWISRGKQDKFARRTTWTCQPWSFATPKNYSLFENSVANLISGILSHDREIAGERSKDSSLCRQDIADSILGNCRESLSSSQIVCLLPESYSTIGPSAATCGTGTLEKGIFTSGLAMGDRAVSLARLPLLHSECSPSRIPPWREAGIKLTCCQRPTRKWYTGGQYSTKTMDVSDCTLLGRAHAAELATKQHRVLGGEEVGKSQKVSDFTVDSDWVFRGTDKIIPATKSCHCALEVSIWGTQRTSSRSWPPIVHGADAHFQYFMFIQS